jgi:hypothetical protein
MIPERPPLPPDDRFRDAARAYLVYGIVLFIGGAWLELHGVGTRGGALVSGIEYLILGLVFLAGVPYLLRRRRAWFERWVLSRRDFARVLTVFMAYRAYRTLVVVLRPETASVAAPWDGEITFRAGAAVFFLVTLVALLFVAVAAWSSDQKAAE